MLPSSALPASPEAGKLAPEAGLQCQAKKKCRHAPALVGLGQQQSYCKFNDKSLIPKEKNARKRVFRLLSRILLHALTPAKENRPLEGLTTRHFLIVSRLSVLSIPFLCTLFIIYYIFINFLYFHRCYPFFLHHFCKSPTDFKNRSRVFWRRRGYQAPPPLLKNTPGVCRAPALTACPCRSIAACSGRRCQVLRVKWWTTGC